MATAFGKVILMGEHSVVYGHPAVVTRVPLPVTVRVSKSKNRTHHTPFTENVLRIFSAQFQIKLPRLHIESRSELPVGSGLGSSAAYAYALFQELISFFELPEQSPAQFFSLVQQSEQFAHGNPSGIDTTAVVMGGVVQFHKRTDSYQYCQLKSTGLDTQKFFLIDSGTPVETTKDMVEHVRFLRQNDPHIDQILNSIGTITKQFIKSLKDGQFDHRLLKENNELLQQLGVVGETAKKMIRCIEDIGGVAKITGAGGKEKGSGMVLAYHSHAQTLDQYLTNQAWTHYPFTLENL